MKVKCEECENGRWYDASHGCSRTCRACEGTGKVDDRPISKRFNLPKLIQGLGTVQQEVEWHTTKPSGRQMRISKPEIIQMAIEILQKVQERGL